MKIFDVFVHLERETPDQQIWERALEEDSNLAYDWLWLATQVEGDKRQYALRRACDIDPQAAELSETQRGTLAAMLRLLGPRKRAADPCAS